MQRKVTSRSDIEQQSLFILFGHLVEFLSKMTPQDTRFKAEQRTDLSLGGTVMGRVRLERNFKSLARIRRMKTPCPSQLKSILWEERYVGLTCVRLFHPWP